jgi:hypothetical protein
VLCPVRSGLARPMPTARLDCVVSCGLCHSWRVCPGQSRWGRPVLLPVWRPTCGRKEGWGGPAHVGRTRLGVLRRFWVGASCEGGTADYFCCERLRVSSTSLNVRFTQRCGEDQITSIFGYILVRKHTICYMASWVTPVTAGAAPVRRSDSERRSIRSPCPWCRRLPVAVD